MTYAMQEEKRQQCECNGVFSLRQDFPVYSVNGNHARAVRQRCHETRKKCLLKNFMIYTTQEEEEQQWRCKGGFFESGRIFRFTVLTKARNEQCRSISMKREKKDVKKFHDLCNARRGLAAMRV